MKYLKLPIYLKAENLSKLSLFIRLYLTSNNNFRTLIDVLRGTAKKVTKISLLVGYLDASGFKHRKKGRNVKTDD